MHNTMWSAVAGSMYQMKRLDIIANNLANANTTGYRGDRIQFSAYLNQIQSNQFSRNRESLDEINQLMTTRTTHRQGGIIHTENATDMAINGEGFFALQTPNGVQYTRAGNFRLDTEGNLVSNEGYLVQSEGGAIQIRDGLPFEVDEQGNVYQGEDEVGRLQLVEVQNPETLQKVSGSRFKATSATRVATMEAPQIIQRSLEGSNVNPLREMGQLLQTSRAFESYQSVIGIINSINQQANNKLSSLS